MARAKKITKKTSVFKLGFSTRIKNGLRERMVKTVADLTELTENQLLQTSNIGKKSVQEIKDFLEIHGFELRKD